MELSESALDSVFVITPGAARSQQHIGEGRLGPPFGTKPTSCPFAGTPSTHLGPRPWGSGRTCPMQQIIHIGATPPEENCAQFGAASYNEQSLLECSVYKRMLMRTSPPPDGASLLIKSFPYDGGHYREVCVSYEDSSEIACTYAFNLESKGPVEWDPIARYELAWFERRAVFQRGLRDGSVRETDVPAQYARSEPPSEVYARPADSTASLFALFPI